MSLQIYLTRRVLPCVWPKSVRKKTFPCSSLQTELSVQFLKIWVSNIEWVKLDLAHQGCRSQLLDSHLRVLCSRWGIRHQLPTCKHVLIAEHIGIYVSSPITVSLIYVATLLFPQLFSVNSRDQELPPVHTEHPQISHQILILVSCASETTITGWSADNNEPAAAHRHKHRADYLTSKWRILDADRCQVLGYYCKLKIPNTKFCHKGQSKGSFLKNRI